MTDRPLKDLSKNDLIREVIRLRVLLAEQLSAAPGTGPDVSVHGIVGMSDGTPIVTMRAGEAAWQFTPAQARQHALLTLDAAVEAERDAATVAFLRNADDGPRLGEQSAGGFLIAMRDHRREWVDEFRRLEVTRP